MYFLKQSQLKIITINYTMYNKIQLSSGINKIHDIGKKIYI